MPRHALRRRRLPPVARVARGGERGAALTGAPQAGRSSACTTCAAARLAAEDATVDSIIRELADDIDLSVSRLLATGAPGPTR